jgi:hypothetical protein
MVISRDQHAGQNRNSNVGNKSFEMLKQLRYLGKTLTNQNLIHEEIKSRLKSKNSEQNRLPSRNIKDTQNYNFACCSVWV